MTQPDEVLAATIENVASSLSPTSARARDLRDAAKRLRELAADAKRIDKLEALVKVSNSVDLSYEEAGDDKGFSLGWWNDDGLLDDRDVVYDSLREALDDASDTNAV